MPRQFNEEGIVFTTSGAGTTGYPLGIKRTSATTLLYIQSELKMNKLNYKISRRTIEENVWALG